MSPWGRHHPGWDKGLCHELGDDTVSVIATATNTVAGQISRWDLALKGVAVTPDGTHVYVTNRASDTVSVIKTANRAVVATIPVGNYPTGVAFTPDGTHVYVTNVRSPTMSR